jgi:hypothetical protein
MPRLAKSLVLLAAATVTGPALAADWNTSSPEEIYRGAYSVEPQDWTELGDDSDGVHMETGLRYWYSWGTQSFDVGGENFSATDNAHSVEAHLRIEDDATSTYAKAWAGYTAVITGEYSDPYESAPIVDGVLGYAGADFGWNAMSDGKGTGAGAFFGYNYWNNSPRTGRVNYSTVTGAGDIDFDDTSGIWSLPGASVDDRLELHMLRLGISGKAEVSDFLDISAEVAAVPFATINGILGGHAGNSDGYLGPYPGCDVAPPDACAPFFFKASPTEVSGWGYGAMAELMAGIRPTENITMRLGGRAWYVQGTYDATYTGATVTAPQWQDPSDPGDPNYSDPTVSLEDYIETKNPFELFRYGLLAELTYAF